MTSRPEIVDFGGLGGPGRPGNLPKSTISRRSKNHIFKTQVHVLKAMKKRLFHTSETRPCFTPLFHTSVSGRLSCDTGRTPGAVPHQKVRSRSEARQRRTGFGRRQTPNAGGLRGGSLPGYETTLCFRGVPRGVKQLLFHRVPCRGG